MKLTADMLRAMARGTPKESNLRSVLIGLERFGDTVSINQPHRMAQYLAQILHESASFRYDREIWGPTAAQKRYEGRRDLGNVQKGDGARFKGRSAIQLTGRANYRTFTRWAKSIDASAPDFEANPDAVNTDPWEGLAPLWFWHTNNLNRYADQGDIEMVTRRINGGYNGLNDRIEYYSRAALVLLGFKPDDVREFQKAKGLTVDGIAGPRTRAAMHKALVSLSGPVPFGMSAPVTEIGVPDDVDRAVEHRTGRASMTIGMIGAGSSAASALMGVEWQTIVVLAVTAIVIMGIVLVLRKQIVNAINDIRKGLE